MQADSDVWLNKKQEWNLSGPTLRSLPTGHSYHQLARTLGIVMWNLHYRGDRDKKKTMQAATVNKTLQFRRRLRDFFAPVWGLPLVTVYVPVHDRIRSEGFTVAANISRRSGGAFNMDN